MASAMPIKPENRPRYPANWRELSASIRDERGNKCEQCGLNHLAVIWRTTDDQVIIPESGCTYDADTGAFLGYTRTHEVDGKFVKIVVTLAHLNHQPEDCRPENLKLWCQRHHLRYDKEHHQVTRREGARAGRAAGDLFSDALVSAVSQGQI